MTGKLSGDEMLRRLDIIAQRRGLARQRRREEEAAATDPAAGRPAGEDPAPGSSRPTAG